MPIVTAPADVGASAGQLYIREVQPMRKTPQATSKEPLRSKQLIRNKTIIIITEASDERIAELLRLLDDGAGLRS